MTFSLFDPVQLGALRLRNRIVMAPLTRTRAIGELPNHLMATYYGQRASAGLIIGEATQVCPEGVGYQHTPGLYTDAQVAGWRRITDAVHAQGGLIIAQLWHVGRISHRLLQPGQQAPVSSSDQPAQDVKVRTSEGARPADVPRPLRGDEIPGVIAAFAQAARRAMAAGFDGVQVHGANGYLLEQFLRDSINHRQDGYGGPITQRARLLLEVMRAVADAAGADRTALRLSPITPANGAPQDSDAQALYGHVAAQLAPLRLAFLEIVEGATGGARDLSDQGVAAFDYSALQRAFAGPVVLNNGYTRQMAMDAVASGRADAVSFGRPFISNPDLVHRLREDAPLAPLRSGTVYANDATGYTDYPALEAAVPAPTTGV
jgi:N-ethylmaleimide reductase